jgi:hypothetical protein
MHGPMNVKSPNNTSKWQMGFNSAFKGSRILKNTHSNIIYRFLRSSKRNISQEFNNNPREVDLEDDQNTDSGTVYKQIETDAGLKIGKRGQKHS